MMTYLKIWFLRHGQTDWTRVFRRQGPSVIVSRRLLGQVLRAHVCALDLARAGYLSNRQGVVFELKNGREQVLEAVE